MANYFTHYRNYLLFVLLLMGINLIIPGGNGSPVLASSVLYAAPQPAGVADCSSWNNACSLQSAIYVAEIGEQIWVKTGVYKPTSAIDRTASFVLRSGVEMYGGFSGNETDLVQRDWIKNPTILSGDIDNNDVNTDGNNIAELSTDLLGSNSYHVVNGSYVDQSTILDGFVITAGLASGTDTNNQGAGMYNTSSYATLRNLFFSGNVVAHAGGAMANWFSGLNIVNVTFYNNRAYYGGGVYNVYGSSKFTNASFIGNIGSTWGGGMLNDQSNPILVNVVFDGNISYTNGGGILNYNHSSTTFLNVTFVSNSAGASGGGMLNDYLSNPTLINVIMVDNTAFMGPQIYNANDIDEVNNPQISYSLIQGSGGSGSGWNSSLGTDVGFNLDGNPLFVEKDGPDNIQGNLDDNLRLSHGSPAIDAGSNAAVPGEVLTDLDGKPRFVRNVDMGAYETPIQMFLPLTMK